ncbi:23S rRNA (guanosine(2251)-2'-O)-methyltransferase RlmB [bacterium]|nr:23S rRNA (guanosine(2251)-2'-O)-methyltransferase RlmB [candidate division CSSED10-310 bacterium]
MNDSARLQKSDLVYGRHAVISGLENESERIEKIWLQRGLHFPGRLTEMIRISVRHGAVLQTVDRQALDRLTGGARHQGIALRISLVDYLDLRTWLDKTGSGPATLLILDEIQDSGNIGAIFRSAAAARVGGIVIPKHGSAPIGGTAMKTSAGTVNQVPVIRVGNIRTSIQELKKHNFRVTGISEKAPASIVGMEHAERSVLVFGNEGSGIRAINLRECDDLRSIPMTGPAGSLNVSAAVAIVLYERLREKILSGEILEKRLDFPENQHRLPDAD